MQTKNNIKNLSFFFLALFVGEAIFGLGAFWALLLVLNIGGWVYWLGFFAGLFLSVFYGQVLGPMSLFIVLFLVITYFLFSSGRFKPVWVVLVSVLANLLFDYFFGLGFGVWELALVFAVSSLVARTADGDHAIRINL